MLQFDQWSRTVRFDPENELRWRRQRVGMQLSIEEILVEREPHFRLRGTASQLSAAYAFCTSYCRLRGGTWSPPAFRKERQAARTLSQEIDLPPMSQWKGASPGPRSGGARRLVRKNSMEHGYQVPDIPPALLDSDPRIVTGAAVSPLSRGLYNLLRG